MLSELKYKRQHVIKASRSFTRTNTFRQNQCNQYPESETESESPKALSFFSDTLIF